MIRKLTAVSAAVSALLLVACGAKTEAELIEAAKASLTKNDRQAAFVELKNAIEKNPESVQARHLLGKTLLESGDIANAVVELNKAAALGGADELVAPDLARALLASGDHGRVTTLFAGKRLKDAAATADLQTSVAAAFAAQSNFARSREAVAAALAAQPDFPLAVVAGARLDAQEGRPDAALKQLDSLLTREPGNEAAALLKSELLLSTKQDTEAALRTYRDLLSKSPGSVAANAAAIALLLRDQKVTEAKAQFQQLKKAAPNHIDTLYLEAQLAYQEGNLKRAREVSDQLVKDRPDSVRVLEMAGAVEFSQQQYVQAEFYLAKALKLSPGLLRARHLLAKTYLRLNQPDKAVAVLKPALESKSVDPNTWSLAGAAWLQTGEDAKADAAFKAAAKSAPKNASVQTASALARASRGNQAAINEIESLAAADPGVQNDLVLISARLSQKDLDGALKAIAGLQRKAPNHPMAYGMRGRVLLLKGDLEGASKSLEEALAKDPAYFPAISSLAGIDLKRGKPDLARQRLEAAIKLRPKDFHAYLALAELSARTGGSSAEVVQLIRTAVKANPGDPAPNQALIAQLLAAGLGKDALEAARAAAGALPNDADIQESLGRAQMAAGEGNQATVTFKKLTSQQPTNTKFLLLLADAYVLAKNYGSAAQALRQALTLQPTLMDAKRRLVAVAILDQKPQDGLALARDIQKQDPKSPWGFRLEGEVESSQKRWDNAVLAYRNALQRGPLTENAVNLQQALRRAGRSAEADSAAADWLKANPKDAVFLYHMANAAMVANQVPAAEAGFRKVLDLQPDNALALNNLAWLLVKQGKPGAVPLAETANKLLPDRAVVLDTLAGALAADNQLPRAIEAQLRAVNRDPEDASLKLNLARIYLKAGEKGKAQTQLEALAKLGDKFSGQAEVSQLLKSL